jgi:hypothetical protein
MLMATKIGKKHVTVVQRDGTITELVLTNCKYVPKLSTNLFSITAAIKHGWNISNQGQEIRLTKSSMMIAFDHLLKTEHGQIPAIAMVPRPADLAAVMLEHGTTADINVMHAVLGHANEDTINRTELYYNVKLTGNFVKCHHCALAKAKQKSVSKQADNDRKAKRIGERLYFDISSVW